MAGGFCEGVEQAARFLRIKGRVFPAATESLTLVVRYADGTVTHGESVVHETGKEVAEVAVEPAECQRRPGRRGYRGRRRAGASAPAACLPARSPPCSGGGVGEALSDFPVRSSTWRT
jgi:hypothetical protein